MAHVPGDAEPHKRKRIEGADEGGGGKPARAGGFGQGAPQPPHFGTSLRSLAFSYVASLRGHTPQEADEAFPSLFAHDGGGAFPQRLFLGLLSPALWFGPVEPRRVHCTAWEHPGVSCTFCRWACVSCIKPCWGCYPVEGRVTPDADVATPAALTQYPLHSTGISC